MHHIRAENHVVRKLYHYNHQIDRVKLRTIESCCFQLNKSAFLLNVNLMHVSSVDFFCRALRKRRKRQKYLRTLKYKHNQLTTNANDTHDIATHCAIPLLL